MADQFSDREKAAALDDLVAAFCEEWWDFQGDQWIVIDGSVRLSSETSARVLESMFNEARGRVDPEWLRLHPEWQESGKSSDQVRTTEDT